MEPQGRVEQQVKVLAISDKVVESIYSPQIQEKYCDVDLVVSCGDLPYDYLEYIVTMLGVPLVYVHGNHDRTLHSASGQALDEPRGAISLEGRVIELDGVLIAGLGGSIRYRPRGRHQYTEGEMRWRIIRMLPRLFLNRLRYGRYLDVLVAHSPPFGIHDGDDVAHRGFKTFLTFMRYFKPAYLLHGHKHVYRRGETWQTEFEQTTVVNVYPEKVLSWKLETGS